MFLVMTAVLAEFLFDETSFDFGVFVFKVIDVLARGAFQVSAIFKGHTKCLKSSTKRF